MGRSSERVRQWANGDKMRDVSDCVQAGPMPPQPKGAIPTVVIARPNVSCNEARDHREYKGVVYYHYEPVAWCCLSRAEIPAFKAWAIAAFSTLQIVTVPEQVASINCPPPKTPLTTSVAATDLPRQTKVQTKAQQTRAREQMRSKLKTIAPSWFVAPRTTEAAKQVA